MTPASKNLLLILLPLAILLSAGCQGGGKTQSKTPEDAFANLQKAAKNESFKQMFAVMTPKAVDDTARAMFNMCCLASSGPEVPEDAPEPVKKQFSMMKQAVAAAKKFGITDKMLESSNVEEAMKAIKDKAGFASGVMKIIQENAPSDKGIFAGLAEATIADIKIDGDSATGTVTMNNRDQTFSFQKIEGNWLITPPGS